MTQWIAALRRQAVGTRTAVLVAAVLAVWAVVACLAGLLGGPMGVAAASVAAGLCLAGAAAALLTAHCLRDPKLVLHAVLAGMATRMGVPLGAGLVVHFSGGPLADAGVLYYLLVFYPVALAVETFLSLPQTATQPKAGPKAPQNPSP